MGPIGTIATQTAMVLAIIWSMGALAVPPLPSFLTLLPLSAVCGALLLAPRSVVLQLPISFSVLGTVAFLIASVTWSIDPDVTFFLIRNFVPSIVTMALAAGLLTQRDFANGMVWAVRIIVACTVIALVLFPSTRSHAVGALNGQAYPGWHGFFLHKNKMAPFMVMGIPTIWIFDRNPLTKLPTLGLMAILLVGSTSATGVSGAFVAVIALAWLWVYSNSDDARNSTLLASISVLGTIAFIGAALASFATITSAYGKSTTLSGRTEIWEASLEALGQRPLLGYGFGALFWRDNVSSETAGIWRHVGFDASHAHNAPLDMALQIGLIGLAVFLVLWVSVAVGAWRILETNPELAIWMLTVFAANVVIGFTEDVFGAGWIAIFVAMRVLLMRRESSLMQPSWTEGIQRWSD